MRDSTEPDEPVRGPASPDAVLPSSREGAVAGVLTGTARLHADRSAARRARALMGEWLLAWWGPIDDDAARRRVRDRLAVVLSELVSNAVVHGERASEPGGPQLEVELHEFGRTVRLVVADRSRPPGSPAFRPPPAPVLPPVGADSGRGLFIVDRLSDIWHAQPTSDGLVVWCDFELDAAG